MKKALIALTCIVCILCILAGKLHWEKKIDKTVEDAKSSVQSVHAEERTNSPADENHSDDLSKLTANFPESLSEKVLNAVQEGETISIVAMGSDATVSGEGTWTNRLQQRLNEAYGEGVFQLTVKSYGDDLSIEVVQQQKYEEVADLKPDILLLEPFVLNDNGLVAIENTLDSVEIIINAVKHASEDAVIMLQPPNPIHNATYYPAQVEALQNYAEEQGIIYLNHWTNWPEQTSEDILNYLNEETNTPNEKGHEVWAEYLAKYFTGEEI